MGRVREGTPDDETALRTIQAATLAEPWPALLETALSTPDAGGPTALVLETTAPVGYALVVADGDEVAYVPEFAVHPDHQGEGHGSRLLTALCDRLTAAGYDRLRLTVRVVDDLSLALAGSGFFRFEAIALLQIGGVTYLFSPLNLAVGSTLAALVAANAGVSYLALVQPRACGLEATSGAFASLPALLSGAACCGPTILLVIGVQASATIITGFQLLVPVAVVLLVASLFLVGRTVQPSLRNGA